MYIIKDSIHVNRHRFWTKKSLVKYIRYDILGITSNVAISIAKVGITGKIKFARCIVK